MSDTIQIIENKMKEITIGNDTFDVSESVYHFMKMMEFRDKEITDVNQLISDYSKFMDMWNDFKEMKKQTDGESEFEKKLNRQILVHTIKPKTEYANQQEKRNGKNIMYPIYYFGNNGRLESTAMGGNYPIKDCNIFVKSNKGDYVKIR